MEIVVDTNFIISCLKKNIDIEENLDKLIEDKTEIILLSPILEELKSFSSKKKKKADKKFAELFLKMLISKAINIKIIAAKQKNPDEAIKIFCWKNPKAILATLDKELRKKVSNKVVAIKGKKLEFI